MTIEEIFDQYKTDKKRYRAIEAILREFPRDRDRTPLEQEMFTRGFRMARVEKILSTLSLDERGVLYWRYEYRKPDWEWQRQINEYMSRSTVYRRLFQARAKFMKKYREG